ncbi:hypothetical protein ACQKIE_03095 [Luteibacter sp. NPDC031894]|uniref:hypothetical protein n=1 Tax=Luteibacter sp. NPDC031894 TaxID=3390572 RepID=UPI003D023CB6
MDFTNAWDVVRFAVTSMSQEVTITFKDAAMNILSGVITIPAGPETRQIEVRYNDRGRRRISHVELRAKDIIRLDSFKFRR